MKKIVKKEVTHSFTAIFFLKANVCICSKRALSKASLGSVPEDWSMNLVLLKPIIPKALAESILAPILALSLDMILVSTCNEGEKEDLGNISLTLSEKFEFSLQKVVIKITLRGGSKRRLCRASD